MAELGETDDPVAVVPGNADAIEENARVLRARAGEAIALGNQGQATTRAQLAGSGDTAARTLRDHAAQAPQSSS